MTTPCFRLSINARLADVISSMLPGPALVAKTLPAQPDFFDMKLHHFVVMQFDKAGNAGAAALRLAMLVDDFLVPYGWVGAGMSEDATRVLRASLDAGDHLVVEVEYRGWTPAGELRHPVFKGWKRG